MQGVACGTESKKICRIILATLADLDKVMKVKGENCAARRHGTAPAGFRQDRELDRLGNRPPCGHGVVCLTLSILNCDNWSRSSVYHGDPVPSQPVDARLSATLENDISRDPREISGRFGREMRGGEASQGHPVGRARYPPAGGCGPPI